VNSPTSSLLHTAHLPACSSNSACFSSGLHTGRGYFRRLAKGYSRYTSPYLSSVCLLCSLASRDIRSSRAGVGKSENVSLRLPSARLAASTKCDRGIGWLDIPVTLLDHLFLAIRSGLAREACCRHLGEQVLAVGSPGEGFSTEAGAKWYIFLCLILLPHFVRIPERAIDPRPKPFRPLLTPGKTT
jgi:hypothetical protein